MINVEAVSRPMEPCAGCRAVVAPPKESPFKLDPAVTPPVPELARIVVESTNQSGDTAWKAAVVKLCHNCRAELREKLEQYDGAVS